jgi:AcrR family transcriptional regulator
MSSNMAATRATATPSPHPTDDTAVRERILDAAFSAFMASGFAETSTLEIATRAHVSKRALYAVVGNKLDILVACITERAKRLRVPADLPVPADRAGLERVLTIFGTQLLREISDPIVVSVFRLAIAEAVRAPEVGQALEAIGRETSQAALRQLMSRARLDGLLSGSLAEMTEQFAGLLWGNLMLSLLLGVQRPLKGSEITRRARTASAAFLKLYAQLPPPCDISQMRASGSDQRR